MQTLLIVKPEMGLDQSIKELLCSPDERGYIAISSIHIMKVMDNGKKKKWMSTAKAYLSGKFQPSFILVKYEIKKGNNKHSGILKDIQDIRFPQIKEINLWGNLIESCQILSRVCWPSLKNFSINGNHLVAFDCFRKSNIKSLKSLGLSSNKINTLSSLSQLFCINMERVILEFEGDTVMCENINMLTKLQSPIIDLYIMSKQRISQKQIHECLTRVKPNFLVRL